MKVIYKPVSSFVLNDCRLDRTTQQQLQNTATLACAELQEPDSIDVQEPNLEGLADGRRSIRPAAQHAARSAFAPIAAALRAASRSIMRQYHAPLNASRKIVRHFPQYCQAERAAQQMQDDVTNALKKCFTVGGHPRCAVGHTMQGANTLPEHK